MRPFLAFVSLLSLSGIFASPLPEKETVTLDKRAVSSAVYDDLVFYFKCWYNLDIDASSAYSALGCARPNGNTLVSTYFVEDASILLTSFTSSGVNAPCTVGTLVHSGFLGGLKLVTGSTEKRVLSINSYIQYANDVPTVALALVA
ncbi:hypothetical protein BDZ94DRAFT_1241035 [Collybia nuda]|uniref:Uncharacterized protein n=1 Tax=Collybia nuda TaxID=64659 RepID=A0A9P6C9G3_9AGAR|nr:hypothetical protein BDZ94DRAFT_1241035 [Collybia nuda]